MPSCLAIVGNHLPTKQELVSLFAVCVFVIYSWSLLSLFNKVPSLLLYLDLGKLIGTLA